MGKYKEKIKKTARTNLAAILAIAVIIAGAGTVYGNLNSQDVDMGENPVSGEKTGKTEVLLEGKGYSLEKSQKNDHDLPQKLENNTKDNVIKRYNSTNNRYTPRRYSGSSSYSRSKSGAPAIKTNLKNKTVAAGKNVQFWVEGQTVGRASIKAKNFLVRQGSKTLKGTGSDTHHTYSFTAEKGKNIVRIKVTDPLRKQSTIRTYTITGTEKKKEKETYTVTASFSTAGIEEKYSAPDISGVTVSCKCREGDSAAAVYKALDDAFAVKGYTMDPSASDPAEVSLPSPMTITVPVENGSEEGEGSTPTETVEIDTISKESFYGDGSWVVTKLPSKITGDENISIIFRLEQ